MTATPDVRTRQVSWSWQGHEIPLGLDEAGDGPAILLLPALSSISTRREMHLLMRGLASRFHTIAPDWPGFGDQPRPPIVWTPDALSAFLAWLVREQVPALQATIAAGHAASYALHLLVRRPGILGRLVLLAPTWRGPLPTMAGGDRPLFSRIRRMIAMPMLGPVIYHLNVNPLVVRMMIAGHVYSNVSQLSAQQMREKQQVIKAKGARFGSAAFVTGELDRVGSREAFLDLARRAGGPLLVAYGAETPPKSRAEMEALTTVPAVRSFIAPRGKLGFYEEHAKDITPVIEAFLSQSKGNTDGRRRSGG
jgi:pimeloyl-ACP methyl ester carboxylesterase